MFEKFKDRFNTQKSDDMFVEAATNASARQNYVDKLVKARTKFMRLSTIIVLVFCFNLLVTLFAPSATYYRQSISIINLVIMAFLGTTILVAIAGLDWQIKHLKALEASAK